MAPLEAAGPFLHGDVGDELQRPIFLGVTGQQAMLGKASEASVRLRSADGDDMFHRAAVSLFFCVAITLSIAVFAQSAVQTTSGEVNVSQDQIFLIKATEGGLAEVQLSQLAAQLASKPEVRAFAEKMVDEHSSLNVTMKFIAERLGVVPPIALDKKDQALYDKLDGMKGASFDKAYLKAMYDAHHNDLKEFTAEMQAANDPELLAAVTHGRDVIQEHTEMVDKMAKDNNALSVKENVGRPSPAIPIRNQ
jgi:putative membrane protein